MGTGTGHKQLEEKVKVPPASLSSLEGKTIWSLWSLPDLAVCTVMPTSLHTGKHDTEGQVLTDNFTFLIVTRIPDWLLDRGSLSHVQCACGLSGGGGHSWT